MYLAFRAKNEREREGKSDLIFVNNKRIIQ